MEGNNSSIEAYFSGIGREIGNLQLEAHKRIQEKFKELGSVCAKIEDIDNALKEERESNNKQHKDQQKFNQEIETRLTEIEAENVKLKTELETAMAGKSPRKSPPFTPTKSAPSTPDSFRFRSCSNGWKRAQLAVSPTSHDVEIENVSNGHPQAECSSCKAVVNKRNFIKHIYSSKCQRTWNPESPVK